MDKKDFLFVGFVSFCPPSEFDEDLARKYTKEILGSIDTQYPNINKVLVSGLVNVGGLKIGYEEARNLDWLTMGIACEKAYDFKDDWFPVELTPVIVGKVWGEESDHFLNVIDLLVRVGGGPQSILEAKNAKSQGKEVFEYHLPRTN